MTDEKVKKKIMISAVSKRYFDLFCCSGEKPEYAFLEMKNNINFRIVLPCDYSPFSQTDNRVGFNYKFKFF